MKMGQGGVKIVKFDECLCFQIPILLPFYAIISNHNFHLECCGIAIIPSKLTLELWTGQSIDLGIKPDTVRVLVKTQENTYDA